MKIDNKKKLYINTILQTLITLALQGTLLQVFLIENGMKEDDLTSLLSVFQLLYSAVILAFSSISDRIRGVIKTSAFSCLLCLPIAIYFSLVSIVPSLKINIPIFIICSIVYYTFLGIYTVISTKIIYLVMPSDNFGGYVSKNSLVGGLFGVACSMLISMLQLTFSLDSVMSCVYVIITLICFAKIALLLSLKPIKSAFEEPKKKKIRQNILKYKPFTQLIIPNFIRGIGVGIIGFAVTIGYYTEVLDSSSASILLIVTNASTIGSSFLLTLLDSRVKYRTILIISGICALISMPLMVVSENAVFFILFYGLAYFAVSMLNITIPIVILKTVDYEFIGQYTGGRLLLHTLSISVAGFICLPLINAIGTLFTLVIAGASQFIAGLVYFMYLKERAHNEN